MLTYAVTCFVQKKELEICPLFAILIQHKKAALEANPSSDDESPKHAPVAPPTPTPTPPPPPTATPPATKKSRGKRSAHCSKTLVQASGNAEIDMVGLQQVLSSIFLQAVHPTNPHLWRIEYTALRVLHAQSQDSVACMDYHHTLKPAKPSHTSTFVIEHKATHVVSAFQTAFLTAKSDIMSNDLRLLQ